MIPFASGYWLQNKHGIGTVRFFFPPLLLLYLIAIKLIENYRGKKYANITEAFFTFRISRYRRALRFSFCDTFWFNATKSNYFEFSIFLFALIVWLMMIWNEHSNETDNEKYIILMAYLIGLSFGVHLMSVLGFVYVCFCSCYEEICK